MSIEGYVDIKVHPNSPLGESVQVSTQRPTQASKIFIGRAPADVLSAIPLLFSICGIAQSRASLLAIQQCLNINTNSQHEASREMLLLVENAKEHLLRIHLDWPRLFSTPQDNNQLPLINNLVKRFENSLFKDKAFQLDSTLSKDYSEAHSLINELEELLNSLVFDESTNDWCIDGEITTYMNWLQSKQTTAALATQKIHQHGWFSQGHSDCKQLPILDCDPLLDYLNADNANHFIAEPQWEAACYETSTLSRQLIHPLINTLHKQYGTSLITRWTARLTELSSIPNQLRQLLLSIENNDEHPKRQTRRSGIAQVEAARGRLIHRVEIQNGLISNYQIIAPTEWNFHPQGVASQSIRNINSHNEQEFEDLTHIIINTIDPCVGYKLDIHHA